jgi:hypothetical protein
MVSVFYLQLIFALGSATMLSLIAGFSSTMFDANDYLYVVITVFCLAAQLVLNILGLNAGEIW